MNIWFFVSATCGLALLLYYLGDLLQYAAEILGIIFDYIIPILWVVGGVSAIIGCLYGLN